MNRVFDPPRLARLLVSWEIGSSVGRQFVVEAKREVAEYIEAEHMLLALAAGVDSDAGRLLKEFGLDHARLADALHAERRQTMAFVCMTATYTKLGGATDLASDPALGTPAKMALRR